MNTLRDILGKPVLFHTVLYHGKNGIATSPTGYLSTDPDVIGDQLSAMQNLGGLGCGVIGLTYGPTVSSFINNAAMEVCAQCEERQMPFALCYDPWTVKNPYGSMPLTADATTRMIAALRHPNTQAMMSSRAYITSINGIKGKLVLDFGTTASPAVVNSAVPGLTYWKDSVDYAWPLIASPNGPAPVNNNVKLPCVCRGFMDGTGPNRNVSVWNSTAPARIIPPNAGNYFWSLANTMNPAAEYAQVVTWNDEAEGTGIESFAAMLYGKI